MRLPMPAGNACRRRRQYDSSAVYFPCSGVIGSALAGAPDEAAVSALVGPDWRGATNDRAHRQRSEIPTVEAVRDIRVHQKDLAWRDGPAASPGRQITPAPVARLRFADVDLVDRDAEPVAADNL